MTVSQQLRAAKRKLIPKWRWVKGAYKISLRGLKGWPDNEKNGPAPAVARGFCYCAVGALEAVKAKDPAYKYLRTVIGQRHIESWNDSISRTHADVIKAFDKAIVLATKAEKEHKNV